MKKKVLTREVQIKNMSNYIEQRAGQLNMTGETLALTLCLSLIHISKTADDAKGFFQTIINRLEKGSRKGVMDSIATEVQKADKQDGEVSP